MKKLDLAIEVLEYEINCAKEDMNAIAVELSFENADLILSLLKDKKIKNQVELAQMYAKELSNTLNNLMKEDIE